MNLKEWVEKNYKTLIFFITYWIIAIIAIIFVDFIYIFITVGIAIICVATIYIILRYQNKKRY